MKLFSDTLERFLPFELAKNRIEPLPVIDDHAFQAGQRPRYHRDPFDPILVAQAQVELPVIFSNNPQ